MLISYQEALKRIHTKIAPLNPKQTLPLLKTINRISASDVYAKFALPKSSISLKEGYGVALVDGQINYTLIPYATNIETGYAVSLSTGQSIPQGINAIIPEEEALVTEHHITIPKSVALFQHVKHAGEDICQNECILGKYERISAQKITALSSQGISSIKVFKKPHVAIISIGNDLASGHIHNSNAMSLAARIIELGGETETIEICEEDSRRVLALLETCLKTADCIITTGAMSQNDVMNLLLQTHLTPLFHHVRIAPAKPSALTLFQDKPTLHLPGLPLACMLGFEMLGVPLLRQLQHLSSIFPDFITCTNQKRILCKPNCVNAIPGYSDGRSFVSAPYYEAGRLNILSQCNGYILVEDKEWIEEGEDIPFFFFAHPPVS